MWYINNFMKTDFFTAPLSNRISDYFVALNAALSLGSAASVRHVKKFYPKYWAFRLEL